MKLYEIPTAIRSALDTVEVDEETGELLNLDALHAVEAEAAEKIAAAGFYLLEEKAEEKALSEAIDRMRERLDALKARNQKLRDFVLTVLPHVGGRVKRPDISIFPRRTPYVVIDDEAAVPADFKTEEVLTKIDKTALKKALSSGDVSGAHLEESVSLQVR